MLGEVLDSNSRKRKREEGLSANPPIRPAPSARNNVQHILQSASHFKIENSVLTNVQGDAVIFRFDGGGPLNEEFRSLFSKHVAGLISVQDFDKVEKHVVSQSIRNLPRAGAAYNDYTSKDRRRTTCFEGTRQALLEEVATWATDPESPPVYLLSGPAGMGKSTVAQTVSTKSNTLRSLGASFFFSRDEAQRRNAERFFTTIAFQLCSYDANFADVIGDALTMDKGASAPLKEPLEQLRALILEPLGSLAQERLRPVLIVVDALDECEEEDGLIVLTGLDQLVQELPSFKVFLTTRPQPHLQHLLDSLVTHKVFHLQNIEEKIVDNDIRLYLKHNLSLDQVKTRLPYIEPWSADEDDLESLVQGAGRLFIIASTAILFIVDKTVRDPQSQLKKLLRAFSRDQTPFNALNNFYTVILRSAVPADSDSDVVKRYQAVMGAIVVAQEPLPIEALADLTGLPAKSIRAVLLNLQPVIALSDNDDMPRIYHKSFPDFITDPKRCKDSELLVIPGVNHTNTATCCLQVMNTLLRRNILGIGAPARFFDNVDALREENIPEPGVRVKIPLHLRYACLYWANHAVAGDIRNADLIEELTAFAEQHVLHWFEALSWMNKLISSHHALPKLVKSTSEDMRKIFSDSLRFISKFFESVQQSALHTYHSALPFAPTESTLYGLYKKETIDNLCRMEGGLKEWDPLIAIRNQSDIHHISRILFSPDSSQFASWTDESLKLWDATSGIHIRTFNSNKIALAGDFSVLALSRNSTTATMYNIATNAPFSTFKHSSEIVTLSLSFDGSRLAVGLVDGTISLWDAEEDRIVAILEGYTPEDQTSDGDVDMEDDEDRNTDPNRDTDIDGEERDEIPYPAKATSDDGGAESDVCAPADVDGDGYESAESGEDFNNLDQLAFSPSGDRVAFVSNSGIKLCNSTNGKFIANLEHQSEKVVGFTFSRSGSRLASLSKDSCSLRLWNINNGTCLDIAANVGRMVVAPSDGPILAACGTDGTVRLWSEDLTSTINTSQATNESSISSFAFSCGLLAMAFNSAGVLTLFNAQDHATVAHLQVPMPASIALSPDGSRLVVGNEFGDIHLWDVPKIRAPSPKERVTALTFSLHCDRLVSGFSDGTVELWDTNHIEQMISKHKIHSDWVTTVAFSSEGDRYASGSLDKTVSLWNGKDGSPVAVVGHTFVDKVASLAISSRLLAVATMGGIILWDHKSSRFIDTFDEGADLVSFAQDGSLLASAKNDPTGSCVFLWDMVNFSPISEFTLDFWVERLSYSTDGSKLAVLSDLGATLVDVTNKKLVDNGDSGCEDLDWIPRLNGIQISWVDDRVLGRFSEHHNRVPILRIPSDVTITAFAAGLSLFALGCKDGRILFIRNSVYS